jgi:hypothetical protein
MREIRKSCPHCGHGAFRLIEGTVEGAECLGCRTIFSLRRKSEPDTTGHVEGARRKGFKVVPPGGIESELITPVARMTSKTSGLDGESQ